MNRQQRRKMQREKGKEQQKEIQEMEKDFEVLRSLPMKQLACVNRIITKSTDIARKEFEQTLDRNLTAVLIENGFTIKQIRAIQDRTYFLSEEDSIKLEKLEKEKVDMAKLQAEVKEYMKELIGQGKGRKEVVEETLFKYPKLSKTMVNNAFGKIQDELELEDAAAYILEDNKNIKKVIEKEDAKKIAKEVARQIEKEMEEVKEEKVMCKLKIKKVELEGEFGSYIREGDKVIAGEITFNSIEELEEYQRKEIDLFNRRMEEIKEVYKIG